MEPRVITDGEKLLTPREVSEFWKVGTQSVTRWAKAGKLPGAVVITPGGHYRFRESVIRGLLNGASQDGGPQS